MKLDNTATIEAHSNAPGATTVAMGIRAEDMAHIMGVLTDLYTNKPRAVIREYSTNAWDAHVAEGLSRPIEVTLPHQRGLDYSPFLTVRDFGSGLDAQAIAEVYSQYGRSTKRDSNDFNGALGLGCKAALTYCSLFTVESIKNAVKTIVEVGRADGGGGVMKVISETPTTEPNGTKVTVPVGRHDIQRFANEAAGFFKFWKPGTVLVDGKAPHHFADDTGLIAVTDDLFIRPERSADRIVMGNVAYPAPELDGLVPNGSIIAFVPLGDVNFPPSRETLADTAATRATLARIKADVPAKVAARVQQDLDTCADGLAVIQTALRWRDFLPQGSTPAWTFKGAAVPLRFEFPLAGGFSYADAGKHKLGPTGKPMYDEKGHYVPLVPPEAWNLLVNESSYRQADVAQLRARDVWDFPNTVWIENYTPGSFTSAHKRKLRKHYADTYGASPTRSISWVLLRGKVPADVLPWIDASRVVAYETIKKIVLESNVKKVYVNGNYVARIPGSYDVYVDGEWKHGLPGSQFPQGSPIFYKHGNQYSCRPFAKALAALHPHSVVVCLSANRIDKFKRDVPKAVEVSDAIKAKRDEWIKALTDEQRLALTIHDSDAGYAGKNGGALHSKLSRLPAEQIIDPDLQKAVKVCKISLKSLIEAREGFALISTGLPATQKAYKVAWRNPLDKYPLFSNSHIEESIRYLNAEYRHLSV